MGPFSRDYGSWVGDWEEIELFFSGCLSVHNAVTLTLTTWHLATWDNQHTVPYNLFCANVNYRPWSMPMPMPVYGSALHESINSHCVRILIAGLGAVNK